jgi:hypothetical protein
VSSFSERLGYSRPIVVDEAPAWLRTVFFNSVLSEFLRYERGLEGSWRTGSTAVIGTPDLIEEIGLMAQVELDQKYLNQYESKTVLGDLLLTISWPYFYETIELVFTLLVRRTSPLAILYLKKVNESFHKGNVAWQMNREGELVRTLPPDMVAVEEELQGANDLGEAAKLHLRKARKFLDERPCDSANAVKESISAIESFARSQPGGGSTLGQTLKAWKRDGRSIPPLLVGAMEKLYGFANDEAGVRHGNPKEESLIRDDAEFVYLTSLAVLRYLRAVD